MPRHADLEAASPRLVPSFAIGSLIAFLLVGVLVLGLTMREARDRAEDVATFHARFVADAVIAPVVADAGPALATRNLGRLDRIVRERILTNGRDVRVKIWSLEGTVRYSDVQTLIGRRFPEAEPDVRAAADGSIVTGRADLTVPHNETERGIEPSLFRTLIPIRDHQGEAVAVVELFQRYSLIQGDVDALVRSLTLVFAGGLILLYALLLPIAVRASKRLRYQNRVLREQAAELTRLLSQEQRTVAELRRLDRMRGDFIAAASHELRTPLTAIIGSLKTAQRSEVAEDPEMRTEILGAAERQSERLLSLVEDLLAAAHIEEGEAHEPEEPFDIGELLEELAEPLRQTRPVRVTAPSALPPIVANRSHVRHAIRCLLDNAGKFSPPESPVDLTADRRNGEIEVRVIDRGPGIEPTERPRIFERFYQTDQSSTRHVGGLGLGLHLALGLARELGGSVDVESEPGSGSAFILRVPLVAPTRRDRGGRPQPDRDPARADHREDAVGR